MKKYIIHIFIFFAIVAAIDLGFGGVCDYMSAHAKGGAAKQFNRLIEKDHYDRLIMGSSKAHHNYIPQVFSDSLGLSCYNAGHDGNGIILSYGILSMMKDDLLPKLIIYDVKQQFDIYQYSGDGDYTRYFSLLKPYYNQPTAAKIISDISEQELLKLHSGLVRYNGGLFNIVIDYLRNTPEHDKNGYEPVVGTLSDVSPQEKDYLEKADSLKLEYFKRFVELSKEKNIRLIIVLSPEIFSSELYDFQPVLDICSDEGITVIDYYNNHCFQKKELFKDHCHMNESGAYALSEAIAHEIKTIDN